ncbi:MAG: hypothetical protein AAB664_03425 [Patescibacteria group bacterium]
MTFRAYLIIMTCVSLCAWVGWIVVLHAIDPTQSGFLGFVLFFLTMGTALLSTLTLLGTVFRIWIHKEDVVYRQVVRSLRQGILFTVLFLAALELSALGLLVWWVIILLILITAFIEILLLGTNLST